MYTAYAVSTIDVILEDQHHREPNVILLKLTNKVIVIGIASTYFIAVSFLGIPSKTGASRKKRNSARVSALNSMPHQCRYFSVG